MNPYRDPVVEFSGLASFPEMVVGPAYLAYPLPPRRRDDGAIVAHMPALPARTSSEAITWAAQQLEQRGAVAFVNGRPRSLADYLSFVRAQR